MRLLPSNDNRIFFMATAFTKSIEIRDPKKDDWEQQQ
jgi:hypothetical protein